MRSRYKTRTSSGYARILTNTPVLASLAGGVALVAGISLLRAKQKTRRYADRAPDRRSAQNMFLAGVFPLRRSIDRSGRRPLFERRQSAYESP